MNPILGYGFAVLAFALLMCILVVQYETMMDRKRNRELDKGFKQKEATKPLSAK